MFSRRWFQLGGAGRQHDRVVVMACPPVHRRDTGETVVAGVAGELVTILAAEVFKGDDLGAWCRRVVDHCLNHGAAEVVSDYHPAGELIGQALRAAGVPVPIRVTTTTVRDATPRVAALYERGLVYHARPFSELERQLLEVGPFPRDWRTPLADTLCLAVDRLKVVAAPVGRYRVRYD